jgi:radical SAM protein with 4Fe4S-binding SPASM domain
MTLLNVIKFKIAWIFKQNLLNFSPMSVVLYSTMRCNFRCDFCHSMDVLSTDHKGDLTLEQFKSILSGKLCKHALRIGFLGGEPFLNNNIFEMLKLCREQRKITTALTNAAILKGEVLEKLLLNPPDVLGISLYDNNENDVISLVKNIQGKIIYWVQMTVDTENMKRLEEKIALMADAGITHFKIGNYHPVTTNKYHLAIYEDNIEYKKIESMLKNKFKNKVLISWPPLLKKNPSKKKCTMPFSFIHVDNKGAIGACCMRSPNHVKYGNINDKDAWNNSYFQKLRTNMRDNTAESLSECAHCDSLHCDLYGI